jgi:hypothetical protein
LSKKEFKGGWLEQTKANSAQALLELGLWLNLGLIVKDFYRKESMQAYIVMCQVL